MLLRLLVILIILIPSWYFSDMDSLSRLHAYVFPIITFVATLALCLWIIDVFAHLKNKKGDSL